MTMKKIDDFNNVTLILYIELNQIQKLIIIVYLRLIDTIEIPDKENRSFKTIRDIASL